MAGLSERQIKEQDVDWFCLIAGRPAHIASMGGVIPKAFCDLGELRMHQELIATMDPVAEVRLNDEIVETMVSDGYDYLQDIIIKEAIEAANRDNPGFVYLDGFSLPVRLFASSFVEMARRGFRSYARREGKEKDEYVLIAEPKEDVRFEMPPLGLKELRCGLQNGGSVIVL